MKVINTMSSTSTRKASDKSITPKIKKISNWTWVDTVLLISVILALAYFASFVLGFSDFFAPFGAAADDTVGKYVIRFVMAMIPLVAISIRQGMSWDFAKKWMILICAVMSIWVFFPEFSLRGWISSDSAKTAGVAEASVNSDFRHSSKVAPFNNLGPGNYEFTLDSGEETPWINIADNMRWTVGPEKDCDWYFVLFNGETIIFDKKSAKYVDFPGQRVPFKIRGGPVRALFILNVVSKN